MKICSDVVNVCKDIVVECDFRHVSICVWNASIFVFLFELFKNKDHLCYC